MTDDRSHVMLLDASGDSDGEMMEDKGYGRLGARRGLSRRTMWLFGAWTALFWGGTVVFATIFYFGGLDFPTSARLSLYGISIWLNGWLIPLLTSGDRPKLDVWHECLSLWLLSYAMTNLLWEIPWLLTSPYLFHDMHTLDDVVAKTEWMRESPLHMYYWVLASFSSVDLRTINHNSTFYSLELYAFVNVASIVYFFVLNNRRSPLRYLVPVLGSGEPIAATFIFSMSEALAGFPDMSGGVPGTLLALVWTQYQYILFPAIFGYVGLKLLVDDWRVTRWTV